MGSNRGRVGGGQEHGRDSERVPIGHLQRSNENGLHVPHGHLAEGHPAGRRRQFGFEAIAPADMQPRVPFLSRPVDPQPVGVAGNRNRRAERRHPGNGCLTRTTSSASVRLTPQIPLDE